MKPSVSELRDLYEVKRLSQTEIAKQFNVDQPKVSTWLKEHGIEKQPRSTLANAAPLVRPDIAIVQKLYITDRLTTRQIGAQFNVSKTEVLRWLKFYDIPRRASRGLLNRGITEPTRDELIELVHVQHLSYREIANMFGVDGSAVTHWLKRHHIKQPSIWDTRRKGKHPVLPTKEELEELYYAGSSLTSIGKMYGVSENVIARLCNEYGVEINLSGFNGGKRFQCNDDHLVRSVYEQKVDNWLYEHGIPHVLEPVLPFDRRSHGDFLANGWYIEIWGVKGNQKYTERRKRKTQLYHQNNLPLIELEVHYFDPARNNLWARRLAKKLQTT